MGTDDRLFEDFLSYSSAMTGFRIFHLRGSGQAGLYFSTLNDIVGAEVVGELLEKFRRVVRDAGEDRAALDRGLRREILSDGKLGPVTRNVIKLWYVGTWYELPREWREAYGESEKDRTFVVSPTSYTEGLLWPAIGANPSGAKPLGYGMWATAPRIEEPVD